MLKHLRRVIAWTMPALTSLVFLGMLTSTRVSLAQGVPVTINLTPTTITAGGSITANMTVYLPDYGIDLTDNVLTWTWPDGSSDTITNGTPRMGPGLFGRTETITADFNEAAGTGFAEYTASGTDFYGDWSATVLQDFTVLL
jgi:hypothetical protein